MTINGVQGGIGNMEYVSGGGHLNACPGGLEGIIEACPGGKQHRSLSRGVEQKISLSPGPGGIYKPVPGR